MKKRIAILAAVCLLVSVTAALAWPFSSPPPAPASQPPGSLDARQIAQNLSMITGVAISPLLGVSVVGAWQYGHAQTDADKARLSWYSDPWFFIPAFILVGLCFLKDSSGLVIPAALKKPFDVIETVEHKISGLVATGAFVPLVVHTFGAHLSTSASLGSMGFATASFGTYAYDAVMIPVSMVAFFIVFLASNAINILILISPFSTVDLALKSFRTAILASVTASAFMNPWIGAAWAAIIILISWFIAGWSFRLSHFGLVFIWDFLTLRRGRFTPAKAGNNLFLSRKINKVPARTYGRLTRNDQGELVLTYRPWLVLPARTLVLPPGKYCVGEGAFFSEIHHLEGDNSKALILLPPRYRSHEQELVAIYGLVDVRPVGLLAAWQWLFGNKKTATA
jgi:MFS family permease